MALFKISKGSKANLPATLTEGFCWYTYDDSKFYIDHKDENGILVRKALNAQDAETLMGASLATILNSSDIEIPTSKAVLDAIEAVKTDIYNNAAVVLAEAQKSVAVEQSRAEGAEEALGSRIDALDEKIDNLGELSGGISEETDPTVPAWAKEATKPTYTASEVGALPNTTKLADLTTDATHRTVTDAEKQAWNAKSNFSGNYNDLSNTPNIEEIVAGQIDALDFGIDGIASTTSSINLDRPLKITTTESTEVIEPGYSCVADWNNSVINVTLTDGEQYAVNGGLYLEIPYLTSYGEASNIKFISVGGSFSIYEPDYGYDCNFYLDNYTLLRIDGYMSSMYDGAKIKIVKKQLAGDITITSATFDALNNTDTSLDKRIKKLEAKLSFNGSNTTLGNIYMAGYDLSEKTINIHSITQNSGYDSYVGTLTLQNGFEIRAHRAYYSRVDIYCPYDSSTTTIYDQYMSTDNDYIFPSGCRPVSIKLAYYNDSGSMEWERECTAEELDSYTGLTLEIEGGADVGGNVPVKGVDYWTEEDKAEIKAYIDQVILGGEW